MRRLPLAIFLILALVLGPIAPVAAYWSCPDGTPCVADSRGYHCAKSDLDSGAGVSSCCAAPVRPRCGHGRFLERVARPAGPGGRISTGEHCRFVVSSRPAAPSLRNSAASHPEPTPDSLPPPAPLPVTPPAATTFVRPTDPLGHSPPPFPFQGPSRAPPTA